METVDRARIVSPSSNSPVASLPEGYTTAGQHHSENTVERILTRMMNGLKTAADVAGSFSTDSVHPPHVLFRDVRHDSPLSR